MAATGTPEILKIGPGALVAKAMPSTTRKCSVRKQAPSLHAAVSLCWTREPSALPAAVKLRRLELRDLFQIKCDQQKQVKNFRDCRFLHKPVPLTHATLSADGDYESRTHHEFVRYNTGYSTSSAIDVHCALPDVNTLLDVDSSRLSSFYEFLRANYQKTLPHAQSQENLQITTIHGIRDGPAAAAAAPAVTANFLASRKPSYEELHAWSVKYSPFFWRDLWEFFNVTSPSGPVNPLLQIGNVRGKQEEHVSGADMEAERVINHFYSNYNETSQSVLLSGSQGFEKVPSLEGLSPQAFINTVFFPDAKLNFAENLLRARGLEDTGLAVVYSCEGSATREWSVKDLKRRVSLLMDHFRETEGDRVAGITCNTPETIAAMLAVTGLGGVWASCSPDFSLSMLETRFEGLHPKVLITTDAYQQKGCIQRVQPKVQELCHRLRSLQEVLFLPFDGESERLSPQDFGFPKNLLVTRYADIMKRSPSRLLFPELSFNDPLFILFSSGTTDLNVKPNDGVFYYSTTAWMMWNWHVAALASGGRLLLYEGHPTHPDTATLWKFFDKHGGCLFGTSAKYLQELAKKKFMPKHVVALSRLRTLCSTGSPLYPDSYMYVNEMIKRGLKVVSMSGGSDICSCFLTGDPTSQVTPGRLQAPGLGMDVAVVNEANERVVGEEGELVCMQPFVSQPLKLWNDEAHQQYIATYFARGRGMWIQGDRCTQHRFPHTGFTITGRSDATLNPSGVRICTAEIYRVILPVFQLDNTHDFSTDAHLTSELIADLKKRIRVELTAFHVPRHVYCVRDIPKTLTGKLMEKELSAFINGRPLTNVQSAQNPSVFDLFQPYVLETG